MAFVPHTFDHIGAPRKTKSASTSCCFWSTQMEDHWYLSLLPSRILYLLWLAWFGFVYGS